jgi:hypothetical protein
MTCKCLYWRKYFSRKGAKAQRKTIRNAVALCAFAPLREKSSEDLQDAGLMVGLRDVPV